VGRPLRVGLLFEPSMELEHYLLAGFPPGTSIRKLRADEDLADSEVAIGWRTTAAQLEGAELLKLWINPGAGVQQLLPAFRAVSATRSITLVNNHGNSYATAQHAVGLLLALTNKVIPHHNWMQQGRWRLGDESATSVTLRRKTVGLLGYGAVNRQVHRFLSGFELVFCILQNTSRELDPALIQYVPEQLDLFLRLRDIVIVAAPLTESTRDLIGERELALLGPEALLVNISRGPVINEGALYRALRDGVIAGAAIDVWYDYNPEPDAGGRLYPYTEPFHELPSVVLSPHRAASPMDDLTRWDEVIDNVRRFASGQPLLNVVDLERGY
jgi:phosphoglycerate dehydrogenase-like enzyme